jgi:hypothetical protein
MRRALVVLALLASACAHGPRRGATEPKPEIVSSLMPRVAFAPLTAVMVVRLHGTDEQLAWSYCQKEIWEWGDGRSEHEEDCGPWEPGTRVRRTYEKRHKYFAPGEYELRFLLGTRLLAVETLQAISRTP